MKSNPIITPTIICLLVFLISCKKQEKVDLMKLKLTEKIENIIDFNDSIYIGVETVEYPFCLLAEIDNSTKYTFDGMDLKKQKVYFQINSDLLKTDSITKSGGGHIDFVRLKKKEELTLLFKKYKADDYLYGFRIEMKSSEFKNEILKKLENKYGKGTKNPNTDNGLYWNLKKQGKYIFYSPDYNRVTILNNAKLSKTCYWDTFNGLIDFGGCNNENYFKELLINTTKPENMKNKPLLTIHKDWSINDVTIGKSNENDFKKSKTSKNFERNIIIQGSNGAINELTYDNDYNNFYFFFDITKKNSENPQYNIVKAYSLTDFSLAEISFENGLKPFSPKEEIAKKLGKDQIENYDDLKFSNYIEIKNAVLKIQLMFNDKNEFSSIYVVKK
ncbi:hypothetical protein DMB65_16570 [Flavobacterium cheongpyeongense]|uniref:Uncharacterized protein n=1 Tax=Flavobacterium cheongpyeongense TaxID=2212651 RepID=A0A2V4BL12_9FLAO|nr:hypothetical protein [Flavobacterium cheongpyeongense]PXY39639.1 hypothetical protein DMB65_16570 [Flavobacterium cheongpyeongense]